MFEFVSSNSSIDLAFECFRFTHDLGFVPGTRTLAACRQKILSFYFHGTFMSASQPRAMSDSSRKCHESAMKLP